LGGETSLKAVLAGIVRGNREGVYRKEGAYGGLLGVTAGTLVGAAVGVVTKIFPVSGGSI